jgi:molybdopterin/thiamine biosynthesis adenylyltransferase
MTVTPEIEIRVPAAAADALREIVVAANDREAAGFALVSHAWSNGKALVLVRKVFSLADAAYVPSHNHGAKWQGGAMVPIINDALSGNFGIMIFHTHNHSGLVRLSDDDRRSACELLPVFQNLVPARPHGSVVFGKDHAAGVVLLPDRPNYLENLKLRWIEKTLTDFPSGDEGVHRQFGEPVYDRQKLLIGDRGQQRLRHAKVAVAGLGGGGSHVVQQLAHMGVGDIIGIDFARAEATNRSRLIGMGWLDDIFRTRKTNIMARMVRRINRQVRFIKIPWEVPDQRAIDELKRADVIVGCLDTLHARADLHEIAWRYLIPYVDIGLQIQRSDAGVTIGGNVATFIPGSFCAWCIDFLSEAKLSAETGGRPRSYLKGGSKQAQVVSFNGLLASQAATEVLQLLTGFAPVTPSLNIKKFNGLDGTLESWEVRQIRTCSNCQRMLAAGDAVWQKI